MTGMQAWGATHSDAELATADTGRVELALFVLGLIALTPLLPRVVRR